MKKKIMAFLLAAAMVVGSATSASAATLDPVNGDELIRGLSIMGVDANREINKKQEFKVNNGFDFKNATKQNAFTAAWSSQTDDVSKAIVSAWQNGQKVMYSTSIGQYYESNGAWTFDAKLEDTLKLYGDWATTGKWNKALDQATNMAAIQYDAQFANVFAVASDGNVSFRSGMGVILAKTVADLNTEFQVAEAELAAAVTPEDKIAASNKIQAVVNKVTESNIISTKVAATEINTADKVVAFVKYPATEVKQPLLQGIATNAYYDFAAKEAKGTDGLYDLFITYNTGKDYCYDVVSPYEALYTKNVWSNAGAFGSTWMGVAAQATDVYEIMVKDASLEDPNFKCPKESYLNAGDNCVRLWKWNNAMARTQWIERHASYEASKVIVEQSWKDAISPDLIKGYNVAAEKAGLTALNDDAKVGDVWVVDIVKTNGDASNKYTLLQGTLAKTLTDKAKAVKVLHWTGGAWKAVNAEAVRLMTQKDNDSYGILIEENTYSPFLIIEIENEGTVADATAEAAKTPEKSGKTGVSFLGL